MNAFAFDYDQHDYPNGLRLITVPLPYPEVVSLHIVVGAGSRNEVEPGRSGFAHFFEHMMFRGTPAFPPDRYEAVLQAAGAASNAYTDDDRTVYHTTFTREDLETILAMEADRFQNLAYPEDDFRTEALAVYGEYNKDSAEPVNKLFEVLRDHAFRTHPYRHTTMGFLADIVQMPTMYDYSRAFFDRFYRPEYVTLIVAGDVDAMDIRERVGRHWGAWPRGSYVGPVPEEGPPSGPAEARLPWATPTMPYLLLGWRSFAYSDAEPGSPALDLISSLGFSEFSPLYRKLVLEEQIADLLWAASIDHLDPYLFTVLVRPKASEHLGRVREEIEAVLAGFRERLVEERELERVKRHLRYSFIQGLNSAENVANSLAHYISLRRTPETINCLYRQYEALTPLDLQRAAGECFTPQRRTAVTLEHDPRAEAAA